MSRPSAKRPYYTTFKRYVRRHVIEATPEIPLDLIQQMVRAVLNGKKHTIIESTWTDEVGQPGDYFIQDRTIRLVSVKYVTGGMRHGLGPSTDFERVPHIIEFARAHNLPRL